MFGACTHVKDVGLGVRAYSEVQGSHPSAASTTLSPSLELCWYPEGPSDPLGLQVHLQPHSVILALRFQTQVLTLAQRGL